MTLKTLTVVLALLAISALAACGSGGSPTTAGDAGTTASSPRESSKGTGGGATKQEGAGGGANRSSPQGKDGESRPAPPREPADFTLPQHHDSGGGAKQFETKTGDNSIQESGSEASGSEFTVAAAALHAYLDARAAHAWATACEYLSAGLTRQLTQISAGQGGQQPSCAELLAGLSAGLPPSVLREVAVADVGSLRVEGDSGFLLFHGANGVDWFVPMVREDGTWKVAALAPSALQ